MGKDTKLLAHVGKKQYFCKQNDFCHLEIAKNGYKVKVVTIDNGPMAEQITHEAIVRALEGEQVRVEIVQQAACAACKAKSMCTASETMVKEIVATPTEPMEVGDHVIVAVEKRLGWKAVLLAFVLPFVLLLAMVALLPRWIASEAIVGTVALCSLVPYYLVLHLLSGRFEQEYKFVARKGDLP